MKKGILLSISSLPSPYGIGTFGKSGYLFCNFLKKAKQDSWQILPLSVTSYGDSPYQSPSSYAINPYFIDLDLLCEQGLLKKEDYENVDFGQDQKRVDYGKLFENRKDVLKKAVKNFKKDEEYKNFVKENENWLSEYALFMTIKEQNGYKSWIEWDKKYKFRDQNALNEIKKEQKELYEYYKVEQYLAFTQWQKLKKYANEQGIEIIGDMPIYSSLDSHDVWANPQNYLLTAKLTPKSVAGVPPDGFSSEGQLWGNPLYDWKKIKEDGFEYWINKLKQAQKLYDVVRIDHFRGFEAFFSIPYGKTPKEGKWIKAPGKELFETVKKNLDMEIIAEDLGLITPAVRKLLSFCNFPNMRVLQFGFDTDLTHEYLPHNYPENCVGYTGTHDNLPTIAWYESLSEEQKKRVEQYAESKINPVFGLIKKMFRSKADRIIIPIQDYLLDREGRMNAPGTEMGNWTYRIEERELNRGDLIRTIRDLCESYEY